jgi:flagellin
MRINTNVSSLVAQEASVNTSKNLSVSLEKLSSGLRINKASDDASGLAIADKLRTQATSINQGISNGNSAVTLLQIADKSMSEQSSILDTIKSKLIQANTDTTSADGRESIRKDIKKLLEQLDNIAEQTNYNGNVLLQKSSNDTGKSSALNFQIGETNNDIIKNTSIQSNTVGLGSKDTYENDTEIKANASLTLASTSAITIKGTNASGSNVAENVTLTGDVDSLKLTAGMTISNTNAATKAILDTAKTAGDVTEASGTYTVTTAGVGKSLNLSTVNDVQATINIATTGSAGTIQAITAGQVVTTTATSGALFDTLEDNSKFEKGADGAYRALSAQTLSISQGEEISFYSLNNVVSGTGSTTFNAGDVITANDVTTGSFLDLELKDTSKFKQGTGANADKFTVLADYTAGDLNIGAGEKITITQGVSVGNIPADGAGLTASAFKVGPTGTETTLVRLATGSTSLGEKTTASGGAQHAAANGDILKFTITAATGSAAGSNYNVKAGDVIKFTDTKTATGAVADELSRDILESGNFLNLGSGKYQAIADGAVTLDVGDTINITRTLIGSGAPVEKLGNASTTKKGEGSAAAAIEVTSNTKMTVKNNDVTAGNKLAISSTAELSNGGTTLGSLAALSAGEMTAELASTFQSTVDSAITKLNGYRGDIGSTQNQVESAVRNLMTQATNVKAAESIIRDVDYAAESANFNKQNIISQAGSYAISQSNAVQQNVLRLLQ